jgi:hypothetical protein
MWSRARAVSESRAGLGRWFGRFVAVTPMVSAAIVLLLGVGMIWRAVAVG